MTGPYSRRLRPAVAVSVLWLLGLMLVAACGRPSAQATECVKGGAADEAAFKQHFSQMGLSGRKAAGGESEWEFTTAEAVVVLAVATQETPTRFCAQERSRLGTVRYDQTQTLPAGESRVSMGTFPKGSYVVRVSMGNALVRNLTFAVS